MKTLDVLKTFNKEDFKLLKGPVLFLLLFILLAFLIFPKPSKIYHGGFLKECKCAGLKATPRNTKGSMIGDEYCIGVPLACQKTQILKNRINSKE